MANEGYILSVEGSPYAFCTNGIENSTPSDPSWSSDWIMVPGLLRHPSEYINWSERSLPIEGELEVDPITFKLNDAYVSNFALYDGTTFNGNLLTELFTRAVGRNNTYSIINSLVSVNVGTDPYVHSTEVALAGDEEITSTTGVAFSPTQVITNYDMTGVFTGTPITIWIEDEAMNVVGVTGASNNILQIGLLVGVENILGRGKYGSERKYHFIKNTYRPEISVKHPSIIKRNITLWRVNDDTDTSSTSMFPIWRGFIRSNPTISDDGSYFELNCEHKWTYYKNETLDYPGFKYEFAIPTRTYSSYAMNLRYDDGYNPSVVTTPYYNFLPNWTGTAVTRATHPYNKFYTDASQALLGINSADPGIVPLNRAIGNRLRGGSPTSFRFQARNSTTTGEKIEISATFDGPTVAAPSVFKIGAQVCDDITTSPILTNASVYGTNRLIVPASINVPSVAIDYKLNVPGYYLKYESNDPIRRFLPLQYPSVQNYNGDYAFNINHIYFTETNDQLLVLQPFTLQNASTTDAVEPGATRSKYICGTFYAYDSSTGIRLGGSQTRFIKDPYTFKSALRASSASRTTINTLLALFFRTRDQLSLFNSYSSNDIDVTNLDILNDWVSGIDNRGVDWIVRRGDKLTDYLQPYLRFFGYMIGMRDSKIRFNTYDRNRAIDATFSTNDFVEKPSTLGALPENLFNSVTYETKNFETKFTFNDDLSKGRYRVGNTQDVSIPQAIAGITSVTELSQYLYQNAQRFLSIWAYPQYVVKFKTNLTKLRVGLGDVVTVTDWLTPDFDIDNPDRGLLNRRGIVIEKSIDLTTGTIEFTVIYEEKINTSFYSPCAKVESSTTATTTTLVCRENYVRPTNRLEPNGLATYSTAAEKSDYAGSNRYDYQERYITSADDGGVSPFAVGDRVELLITDNTTNITYNGTTAGSLEVLSINPASREITLNEVLPLLWRTTYIPTGKVNIRFTDYDLCQTTQQQEYGFMGDFTFASLDNPLPTPPSLPQVRSSQYSP